MLLDCRSAASVQTFNIGLGSRRAVCQRNGKREFMSGDSEAPFLRGYDIPLHLDDKDSDVVVNIKRKKIIGE